MERLTIRLFGLPRFMFDGSPWRIAVPPRCMQLLAYLALQREAVPRATVAAALWPDDINSASRANLRRHLHQLRGGLPHVPEVEWFEDRHGSIGWNHAAPASIDVADFERFVDDRATRRVAIDLADGELLAGFDDEWLVLARERLRSRYYEALLDEAVAQRHQRNFTEAIGYAERLLRADDLREDAVREIMTARYESGDRGMALAIYERFRKRLLATLSIAPTSETESLAAAMRTGMPLVADDAPLPTRDGSTFTAFAGRGAEIANLRAAWARAARGTGATVFVGGEAGIGKTRLIAEFAPVVRASGGRVVVAPTSDPEAEPYQSVFGALRALFPLAAALDAVGTRFQTLAHALPELRTLVPTGDEATWRNESNAQERLLDDVVHFIEHVARSRPLLLVLEDLHWSGSATIDALGALARRVGSLPVLLVATYRSDETTASHPLRALRAQLAAEHRGSTLALRRLDAPAVEAMLAIDAMRDAPAGSAATIYRLSDGNPLFGAQLARTLIETGALPSASEMGAIGEMIALRLAGIAPTVRAVGEVAAVIGERFDLDLVCDAGGWDEADVIDAIGSLTDATILREAGGGAPAYRFTHALIAVAMYDAMEPEARVARHRRVAQLIERRPARDRTAREAIARHWRGAHDRARASAAYRQSAVAAIEVFARAEAIGFARIAGELADDDIARFAALRLAVAVAARSNERDGWESDLEQLLSVAAKLGDAERFEATALWEAYCWQNARSAESNAAIDELDAIATRTGDLEQRSTALERRSRADVLAGDLSRAMECAGAALAAAEALSDPVRIGRLRAATSSIALRLGALDTSAELLRLQRDALCGGGTIVERLDLVRAESMLAIARQDGALAQQTGLELLELATVAGDRENESLAHTMLAYAAHERYDAACVREHYAAALAIYMQLGRAQMVVNTLLNLGIFESDIGNHASARALWEQIRSQAEALSMRTSLGYLFVHLSTVALLENDAAAALAAAREARAIGEATTERRLLAEGLIAFGAALAASNDLSGGIEALERACRELHACGAEGLVPETKAMLIEALLMAERGGEAGVHATAVRAHLADTRRADRYPARLALALVHEAEYRGDVVAAERDRAIGLHVLAARLALLGDDAPAYAALPFNRELQRGPDGGIGSPVPPRRLNATRFSRSRSS